MITEKNLVQLRTQTYRIDVCKLFACNLIDNDDNNDDICRKKVNKKQIKEYL
jgi:hypothetical protein